MKNPFKHFRMPKGRCLVTVTGVHYDYYKDLYEKLKEDQEWHEVDAACSTPPVPYEGQEVLIKADIKGYMQRIVAVYNQGTFLVRTAYGRQSIAPHNSIKDVGNPTVRSWKKL